MKAVKGIQLPCELKGSGMKSLGPTAIAAGAPHKVHSFDELVKIAAKVSTMNPGLVPYYRGQKKDYTLLHKSKSTLLPGIYRQPKGRELTDELVQRRFAALDRACELLLEHIKTLPASDVPRNTFRRELCQWALLQHYEVCETPLIDVTQSLRVACMFALDGADDGDKPAVFMIGMPYSTGPITYDADNELYIMRLLSLMPPIAQRPFFQEGFLICPEFAQRNVGALKDTDLACRIIAKFELGGCPRVWEKELGQVRRRSIYPDDEFSKIAKTIRMQLANEGYASSEAEETNVCEVSKKSLGGEFPEINKQRLSR